MSRYLIDKTLYATDFTASCASCWGNIYTYDFKIDVSGNVFVKWGQADFREPQPKAAVDLYSIVDNVEVPPYIIDLYKHLCNQIDQGPGNGACRLDKMNILFETVIHLKTSMHQEASNQDKKMVEIQLQTKMAEKFAFEREQLSKSLNQELLKQIDLTTEQHSQKYRELEEQMRMLQAEHETSMFLLKTKTQNLELIHQRIVHDNELWENPL